MHIQPSGGKNRCTCKFLGVKPREINVSNLVMSIDFGENDVSNLGMCIDFGDLTFGLVIGDLGYGHANSIEGQARYIDFLLETQLKFQCIKLGLIHWNAQCVGGRH